MYVDLYDNQIRRIEGLNNLVQLRYVDLSFNKIRELEGLDSCEQLEELYLIRNRIQEVQRIDHLAHLRVLELGQNRLRVRMKTSLIPSCLLNLSNATNHSGEKIIVSVNCMTMSFCAVLSVRYLLFCAHEDWYPDTTCSHVSFGNAHVASLCVFLLFCVCGDAVCML